MRFFSGTSYQHLSEWLCQSFVELVTIRLRFIKLLIARIRYLLYFSRHSAFFFFFFSIALLCFISSKIVKELLGSIIKHYVCLEVTRPWLGLSCQYSRVWNLTSRRADSQPKSPTEQSLHPESVTRAEFINVFFLDHAAKKAWGRPTVQVHLRLWDFQSEETWPSGELYWEGKNSRRPKRELCACELCFHWGPA